MDELCRYAGHPFRFVFRYLRRRPISHAVILAAVLLNDAVGDGQPKSRALAYFFRRIKRLEHAFHGVRRNSCAFSNQV